MTEEKQPTIDWGLIMGVITDTVKEIGVDGFLKGLRGLTKLPGEDLFGREGAQKVAEAQRGEPAGTPTIAVKIKALEDEHKREFAALKALLVPRVKKVEDALAALEGDPDTGAVSWEYMGKIEKRLKDLEDDQGPLDLALQELQTRVAWWDENGAPEADLDELKGRVDDLEHGRGPMSEEDLAEAIAAIGREEPFDVAAFSMELGEEDKKNKRIIDAAVEYARIYYSPTKSALDFLGESSEQRVALCRAVKDAGLL